MKKLSAREILKIISTPYATTKDVMALGNVGKNTALKIKKELKEQLEEENYFIPSPALLPMDKVVEKLNINIPYLKKVSSFDSDNDKEHQNLINERGNENGK